MNYRLEGSGKPLVFIHGLSDNLLYWEFLANRHKHNYQVLRVDLRGHGESELGNGEITIDTYVEDLNGLLEELNIPQVNLVGFSLGGAVALDFTIKNSKKVDSLALMSSFYKADDELKNTLNQLKNALNVGFEEFFDAILPMTLCQNVIDENKKELELLKDLTSQNANVEAYIKAIDACLDFNVENCLSKINIPTLILAGRYDDIAKMDMQNDLHDKIRNSELIVFDNMKHNLLVGKNNEKILTVLTEFLSR